MKCFYEQEDKKITVKVCLKCPQVAECPISIKAESDPKFRWTLEHVRVQEENKKIRSLKKKLKSVVQDKAGTEYFCLYTKEDFNTLPDMRPIEVFLKGSTNMKKYVKKFLTFIKEL